MKAVALYSAGIVLVGAAVAAITLPLFPVAAVGTMAAFGLMTGFFTGIIGTGILLAGHARKNQSNDLSLAGGFTSLAALAAVFTLGDGPHCAPPAPQAGQAFASSTQRPCPDPRRGEPVPETAHCRAEMWRNLGHGQ